MSTDGIDILVVDAEERSAALLEDALQTAGLTVRHACSLGEGYHLLASALPTVVVADTSIGVGGVREVLSLVEDGEGPPPGLLVLSDVRDPAFKLELFEAGIDEFIQKPLLLREVVARIRLVRERVLARRSADLDRDRHGPLSPGTLLELVRSIEDGRRTGAIRLTAGALVGTLWFRDGRLIDAAAGRDRGRDAFERLFTWDEGTWELRFGESVDREVTLGGDHDVLLNAAILHEAEFAARAAPLGDLRRVFTVDYRSFATRLGDLPPETNVVIRMFDGFRTLREAVALADVPDFVALEVVRALVQHDILIELDQPSAPAADDRDFDRLGSAEAAAVAPSPVPPSEAEGPTAATRAASRTELARAERLRREAQELARTLREPASANVPKRHGTEPSLPVPRRGTEPSLPVPRRNTDQGLPAPVDPEVLDPATESASAPADEPAETSHPGRHSAISEPFPVLASPWADDSPQAPPQATTGRQTAWTDSFIAHRSGAFSAAEVEEPPPTGRQTSPTTTEGPRGQRHDTPDPLEHAATSDWKKITDGSASVGPTAAPDPATDFDPAATEAAPAAAASASAGDSDTSGDAAAPAAATSGDDPAATGASVPDEAVETNRFARPDDEDLQDAAAEDAADEPEERSSAEDHDDAAAVPAGQRAPSTSDRPRRRRTDRPTGARAVAGGSPSVLVEGPARAEMPTRTVLAGEDDPFFDEPARARVSPLLWVLIAVMLVGGVALWVFTDGDAPAGDTEPVVEAPTALPGDGDPVDVDPRQAWAPSGTETPEAQEDAGPEPAARHTGSAVEEQARDLAERMAAAALADPAEPDPSGDPGTEPEDEPPAAALEEDPAPADVAAEAPTPPPAPAPTPAPPPAPAPTPAPAPS
ncbi:MAG: DUF4388 domain-containing protein, partial [Deltaproteobacteria bacterium]